MKKVEKGSFTSSYSVNPLQMAQVDCPSVCAYVLN